MNETHNFIQGRVGEFSLEDFKLVVYIDGEKTNEFPTRESGYLFEKIECTNSGTAIWNLEKWSLSVNDVFGPTSCNVYFEKSVKLKETLLTNNTVKVGSPIFANISTDADTGMYTMADDQGTSYYFRGTKTLLNNNLIFANHQWKIIRINGDGSIRMIYNGTCPSNSCTINSTGTATQIGTSAFNPNNNNAKYVGYTYDSDINSTIKIAVENWYANSLSSYDTYISDTVYCNDKSQKTVNGHYTYGAYSRLTDSTNPSLKCINAADKYTKSSEIGNGLLSQKVGLITADEVAISGGLYWTGNTTYYLYSGQDYWTFSPSHANGTTTTYVFSNGSWQLSNTPYGVRPVISLDSNIQILGGNGSIADPYKIKY